MSKLCSLAKSQAVPQFELRADCTLQSECCCQVYVHVSIKTVDGEVLDTTRRDEGGSGVPNVFVVGKGKRAPRGWELAVAGMPG